MKKLVTVLPILALACSVNANAGFLDGLSNVLTKTSNVLGKVPGASTNTSSNSSYKPVPLAQITPTQVQHISQLVQPNTNDRAINQAITEAKPNIEGTLKFASCQNDGNTLMAGKYESPTAETYMYMNSVLPYFSYHPKNQCLTVSSIGNWKLQSKDLLSFSVVYTSDVSPETRSVDVVMKQEADGQWYVKKHAGTVRF